MKKFSEHKGIMKTRIKENWVFIFLLILLFSVLIVTISIVGIKIRFAESTGYYLYSSLLQANAAIISIFGFFFIYKVQSLQSAITEMFNSISSLGASHMDYALKFKQMSIEQKSGKLKDYNNDTTVSKIYRQWYEYEVNLSRIRRQIIKPTIILITAMIFQSIFIILSNELHLQGGWLELYSFEVNIIYESYALVLLAKTVNAITL